MQRPALGGGSGQRAVPESAPRAGAVVAPDPVADGPVADGPGPSAGAHADAGRAVARADAVPGAQPGVRARADAHAGTMAGLDAPARARAVASRVAAAAAARCRRTLVPRITLVAGPALAPVTLVVMKEIDTTAAVVRLPPATARKP